MLGVRRVLFLGTQIAVGDYITDVKSSSKSEKLRKNDAEDVLDWILNCFLEF